MFYVFSFSPCVCVGPFNFIASTPCPSILTIHVYKCSFHGHVIVNHGMEIDKENFIILPLVTSLVQS